MSNLDITSDLVRVQVEVSDWEGAVRAGGKLLADAGICTEVYIDAMVDTVKRLGPYMVLAPGIALAHARPEDGVLKVGISIINLATPVDFGSEANDPVSLVISFGATDKESHIGMLQELATFLMEEKNQELLKTATTIEQVVNALLKT
jgi:mannitol/fructose-specific phosphotransferase system IIA component (Ntr-type)